jgi:hypothetical protein
MTPYKFSEEQPILLPEMNLEQLLPDRADHGADFKLPRNDSFVFSLP